MAPKISSIIVPEAKLENMRGHQKMLTPEVRNRESGREGREREQREK